MADLRRLLSCSGLFQSGVIDVPDPDNVLTNDSVDNVQGRYVPVSEDDVRDGVLVGQGTGNLVIPIEADVRYLTGYGTDGTEFTGTAGIAVTPDPLDAPYLSGGDDVYFIVRRVVAGATVKYIERMAPRFVEGTIVPENAFFLDCGATYDGAPTTTITGLTHLESTTVSALADGVVVEDLLVTGGEITLPNAASFVHIGLPYTSDLETLDFELRAQNAPTIHHLKRGSKEATVKMRNTSSMKIGPDDSTLEDQILTELYTGDKKIPIRAGNHGEAVLFIRNDKPLPIEVQSVIVNVEVGDI
jgi:hypothetical protein